MSSPHQSLLPRRRASLSDRITALTFVFGLSLPVLMLSLGKARVDTVAFEYRQPAPLPILTADPGTWPGWPRGFEAYFNDRYGLRSLLLSLRARGYWYLLGSSPTPTAVRGKQENIFLTASHVLDIRRGQSPLDSAEVDEWINSLQSRSQHLASKGITHLMAIVPDKSAVYPELLPDFVGKAGQRRIDQLVARAQQLGYRGLLDLTQSQLDERQHDGPDDWTYFPLGVHWTSRGALAGTLAIGAHLRELGQEWVDLDRDQIGFYVDEADQGDTYAPRFYLAEQLKQVVLKAQLPPDSVPVVEPPVPGTRTQLLRGNGATGHRLLVFHDSFGTELVPLLSATCQLARWEWQHYDEDIVDDFKPTVVLELFVERQLAMGLAEHNDAGNQARLAAIFDATPAGKNLVGAELFERIVPQRGLKTRLATAANAVDLAVPTGFAFARIDLPDLPPDQPVVLRFKCLSAGSGHIVVRQPFIHGSRIYPVDAIHRETLPLSAGQEALYVYLPPQRNGNQLTLSLEPVPLELRLLELELRTLPAALDTAQRSPR